MRPDPYETPREPERIDVLHVDDRPELAEVTATYLQREDDRFDVTTAVNATDALESLRDRRCDCIVSDYEMPGRNGVEFLSAVREEYPDLPFILYTGKGSEEVASEAISNGVTDYLQKASGAGQYTVLANRIKNAVAQWRATAALEDSQKRLSLLIEQSPLGVLEYNEDFEIVRLNEAGESILGYEEDTLLGRTWERLVTENSYENVDQVTDQLARAEGGYHSIDENVREDGERIICEWHNRVITDDDGEVVTAISLFQDITDRRAQQRELERYKAYLEGSTDIVVVVDADGTVQYQSPSVTSVLGYAQGELLDEDGFEFIHPADRRAAYDAFDRLLSVGETRVDTEFRFRTATGEWRWLEISGTDYRDNPDIEGVVINGRDTTARKRREQRLRDTATTLSARLESSPVMMFVHDTDGNITDPNDRLCEQTGYTARELEGMKLWDLEATITTEELEASRMRMDPDSRSEVTGRYRRSDGSTFAVESYVSCRDSATGRRFIVVSRDVSQRHGANDG